MAQGEILLRKGIGVFALTMYGTGTILGAGIYALIGQAAGMAGHGLWLSFLVGAVIALFSGLSYAELAAALPKAGAEYHYVQNAFGSRLLSFIVGWILVVAAAASAATVSLGFAGNLNALMRLPVVPTALGLIAILSIINFIGINQSTFVNILFTLIEAGGLLFVIAVGALFGTSTFLEAPFGQPLNILQAAAFIFFAYIGFEQIANISEEAHNPQRAIPIALILSVGVTAIIYIGVSLSVVSLVDPPSLAAAQAPLALAVSKALGETGATITAIVSLFATANTALLILVANSRLIFGIARDGSLPRALARIHPITRTPWLAILALTILALAFVPAGGIGVVGSLASWAALTAFTFVNASLIWLRYAQPGMSRPFRTPINVGKFPVVAFLGLLSAVFASFTLQFNIIGAGFVIAVAGIPIFLVFRQREPAKQKHQIG